MIQHFRLRGRHENYNLRIMELKLAKTETGRTYGHVFRLKPHEDVS